MAVNITNLNKYLIFNIFTTSFHRVWEVYTVFSVLYYQTFYLIFTATTLVL